MMTLDKKNVFLVQTMTYFLFRQYCSEVWLTCAFLIKWRWRRWWWCMQTTLASRLLFVVASVIHSCSNMLKPQYIKYVETCPCILIANNVTCSQSLYRLIGRKTTLTSRSGQFRHADYMVTHLGRYSQSRWVYERMQRCIHPWDHWPPT